MCSPCSKRRAFVHAFVWFVVEAASENAIRAMTYERLASHMCLHEMCDISALLARTALVDLVVLGGWQTDSPVAPRPRRL